jgi:hypothetical protein
VEAVTTAKFGIGTGEPASRTPFDDEGTEPVVAGKTRVELPGRTSTGKFGIAEAAEEPSAAPAVKAEAGWDQVFSPQEPASPAAAEAPRAPAPEEADPFTEFAAEAARKRDEKPLPPEGSEGSGS